MGIASRRISPHPISPQLGEDGNLPVIGLAGPKLAATIERVVRQRIGGQIQGLKVEHRGEEIFLLGVCPTFYVKQLAQHAAMKVAGDTAVNNQIKVI